MSMVHSMEDVSLVEFDHMVSIARDGHRCLSIRLSDRFPEHPFAPCASMLVDNPPIIHLSIQPVQIHQPPCQTARGKRSLYFQLSAEPLRCISIKSVPYFQTLSKFGQQVLFCLGSSSYVRKAIDVGVPWYADVCMCVCHLKSEQHLAALLHWAKQPKLNLKFNVS